jgi:hypothetical protein
MENFCFHGLGCHPIKKKKFASMDLVVVLWKVSVPMDLAVVVWKFLLPWTWLLSYGKFLLHGLDCCLMEDFS